MRKSGQPARVFTMCAMQNLVRLCLIACVAATFCALCGCGGANSKGAPWRGDVGNGSSSSADSTSSTADGAAPPDSGAVFQLASATGDDPQTAPARVMIYNATLDLVVKDAAPAPAAVTALTEEYRGYVQSRSAAQIVVRVPSARFDAYLAALAGLGTVCNEQVQAMDVTEEFVDLLARLRSAEAVQGRLRALLERADSVEAALKVEQELKRVDQLVEQLKGQLQVLKNRVAFSTITIQVSETKRPAPVQVRNFGELPFHWLRELNPNHLWE